MKTNEQVKAELEERYGKWKAYHTLMLLVGLTPDTASEWKKGRTQRISIVIVSLFVSSFTVVLPSLLIFGATINRVCVPGNGDYEESKGLCSGNGKKEALAKALAEKKAKATAEKEKKKTDTEATYRAMRYICEETIKSRLREPGSYERINSTFYGSPNGGNKKGVIIEYRARNGFGGMNAVSAGCLTETGRVEDLKLSGNTEQ